MGEFIFGLSNFFEGYVKNYRSLNLYQSDSVSKFTRKEIDFFAHLGEKLGFFSFVEDYKYDIKKQRSRPMDLSWWKSDERINSDIFTELVLHLERESTVKKDIDTINKLFSQTEDGYRPKCVIGIQYVDRKERINYLNKLIAEKNNHQKSDSLMIYRYEDKTQGVEMVTAHIFNSNGMKNEEIRKAVCFVDQTGYWTMSFEEEYISYVG